MFELKRLSKEAVPAALERAVRYRMLGESMEAESICRDVLAADPGNRDARITLLLALTDQLDERPGEVYESARELLSQLGDPYSRAYYEGLLLERRAKARLRVGGPSTGALVHDWLTQAMARFEEAAKLRPSGNDEALLRWNTCARILNQDASLAPEADEGAPDMLE